MTVTDVLETIITLKGADTAIAGLSRMTSRLLDLAARSEAVQASMKGFEAAQLALLAPLSSLIAETTVLATALLESVSGFGAAAAAEGVMAAATVVLEAALALLLSPLALLAAGIAVVTGALIAGTGALKAFEASERSLARTTLQLNNLKGSIPIGELVKFSDHLSALTGINHNVIASLGATASQFGLTRQQIEKALPVVLDVAQAKGKDPEEVLNTLLRASRGRSQGLVRLGIDPAKIHGDLKDINNLIDQVGKGFAGVAEGFRQTLPGTTAALKDSLERLFEALGRFISPVVVPVLNLMISGIDKLTALLDRLARFLHLPTAADLAAGGATADIAFKGDPEQTAALKGIERHTKKTHDALVQGVLGGPGTVARGAFTVRDARVAFGI